MASVTRCSSLAKHQKLSIPGPTSHQPVQAQNSLSLSDEQIRASLLSAVEDKMKRRLRDIFSQAQAEMEALNRTQDDLQKGKTTLDEMMGKLEREQVKNKITIYIQSLPTARFSTYLLLKTPEKGSA